MKYFSVNYVKNIGNKGTDFQLSDEEVFESFEVMNRYKEYFNKSNTRFIQESYKSNFKNKVQCIAGKKFVYIHCDGQEFYCPSSDKRLTSNAGNDCFGKHCICIWEMFR